MDTLNYFIENIITDLVENSKYNICIDNIPDLDNIDKDTLFNTFCPWGSIHMMKKYKTKLYIWYHYDSDARVVHKQLDQMMIEENIISTSFRESKSLIMKYNIQTKERSNVYHFMERNMYSVIN